MKKTIFNVHDYILELADFKKPNRYETYSVSKNWLKDRNDILYYCDTIINFKTYLYHLSHELFQEKANEGDSYEDIESFLNSLTNEEFNKLLPHIISWFDDELDDDDMDDDNSDAHIPTTGFQYAYRLFEGSFNSSDFDQHEGFDVDLVSKTLNIYSTYDYTAEIEISVEEANKICEKESFPIKFVKID